MELKRLFILTAGVSAATLCLAAPPKFGGTPALPPKGFLHCGTPQPTSAEMAEMWKVSRNSRGGRLPGDNLRGPGTVVIPVWFHVMRRNDGTGDVSDAKLYAQLKVMNRAYSGKDQYSIQTGQGPSAQASADTPFRFRLAGITRTNNSTWYNANISGSAQTAMKTALRVGGPGTLNVYLNECFVSIPGDLLGYATFPTSYLGNPKDDGVVIFNQSVPGGTAVPYQFGDSMPHEVGHWLGLFHTFQGGCAAEASTDQVTDTPAESGPFYGMPVASVIDDTCSTANGFPGRDPVENFMDYTDDDGLFQFTAGQSDRMDTMHATYRPNE